MLYRRNLEAKLKQALSDTRVVMIAGPRQAGKTTLARQLTEKDRSYVTLDDDGTYQAAMNDPVSFIRQFDYVTIDEIQRAPELIRRIKISVDEDQRPGRFLLTGSANILTIPTVSESLAGRMTIETLLPLSQAEIEGVKYNVLDDLFSEPEKALKYRQYNIADIEQRVLVGGYPEMLSRTSAKRRRAWADTYIETMLTRDVADILDAHHLKDMDKLLQACAIQSAQLVVYGHIANDLRLTTPTIQRYIRTLEQMYLLTFLPAWHRNDLKRLIKTPKLHFFDSGLLSSLKRMSVDSVQRDRNSFAATLESFIFSELRKHADCSDDYYNFYYYRDKDKVEVDFVIEREPDELIGVEIKASATVRSDDFRSLGRLQAVVGDAFRAGYLIYTGDKILPFGQKMKAVPVSIFWGE